MPHTVVCSKATTPSTASAASDKRPEAHSLHRYNAACVTWHGMVQTQYNGQQTGSSSSSVRGGASAKASRAAAKLFMLYSMAAFRLNASIRQVSFNTCTHICSVLAVSQQSLAFLQTLTFKASLDVPLSTLHKHMLCVGRLSSQKLVCCSVCLYVVYF